MTLFSAPQKRVQVFVDLLENNALEGVSVDTSQSEKLLRVLDTVVIRLEGGTDADIAALDESPAGDDVRPESSVAEVKSKDADETEASKADAVSALTENNGSAKKRKRTGSESSGSSSSSASENETQEKEDDVRSEANKELNEEKHANGDEENEEVADKKADETEDVEDVDKGVQIDDAAEKKKSVEDEEGPEETATEEDASKKTQTVDLVKDVTSSRALHKTSSIFLRNLAPTITKAEVEAVCRRYDGYLRVAIADPLVERRWFRRGWVSFRRDVNIKEICWNLNNIRVSGAFSLVERDR